MLRMSRLADYATVVMTDIARTPHGVHSAAEIAGRVGVAPPTVSKLLKTMARAGLLESLRGPKGGYRLARARAEISMAQIIDSIEGRAALTQCAETPGRCEYETRCAVRGNWRRIDAVVRRALERVTLAEMIEPEFHPVDASAIIARHRRAYA